MIEIIRTGALATVQDLGRPGYAQLGVSRSGAADRGALVLANRLVGNASDTAGIELTLGDFAFVSDRPVTVAITGAVCPGPLGWGAPVTVRAGVAVEVGRPATGLRSYLAIRGGIDTTPVLGSRSTDALGGLGRTPLLSGDAFEIGNSIASEVSGEVAVPRPRPSTLRAVAGPRADWFSGEALATLIETGWLVGADSNRIGVRLAGRRLARLDRRELPTEPTLPGALQVPPDGQPILLGPDAPVTGGYPVIAVLVDADVDWAGQLRPGDEVRFALAG